MTIQKIAMVFLLLCVSFLYSEEKIQESLEAKQISQTIQKMVPFLKARTVAIRVAIGGQYGFGSGAILSSDGIVLTCAHVSEISNNLTVITSEGKEYPAQALGKNSVNDYSLLKIEAKDLPYFELGDSSDLKLMQWVVALGHPGGPYPDNQPAVNAGRVRGLHKKLPIFLGWKFYDDAIQSDAPIFAGNSGGPLVDLQGRLVGINGAIMLVNDLAFSVPIDKIKKDLSDMKEGQNIEGFLPGFFEWIGILTELQEDIPEEDMEKIFKDTPLGKILKLLGTPQAPPTPRPEAGIDFLDVDKKIYVSYIHETGIAALTGLRAKDRILSINGKGAESSQQIQKMFQKAKLGDKFKIVFTRNNASHTTWFIFDRKAYTRESLLQRTFQKEGLKIHRSMVKVFSGNEMRCYGAVVSQEGHILTSLHRIQNLSGLTIQMPGEENTFYKAELVGSHGIHDLALLKVQVKKAFVPLALSKEKLQIGQWVIAGGNEKGVIQAGMVSALDREVPNQRRIPTLGLFGLLGKPNKGPIRAYMSIIQHDANIDSEDFGTPLCNEKGEMVGLNVGHFYRGTVFATPASMVEEAMPSLLRGEHIPATDDYQEYIPKQDPYSKLLDYFLSPEKQKQKNLEEILKEMMKSPEPVQKQGFMGIKISDHPQGIEVVEVLPGYGAEKAGMEVGDIIIAVDKEKINTQVLHKIRQYSPGKKIQVTILRKKDAEYEQKELEVELSAIE
ncbi:MAG: trypsin-like peptidase domain-containing protein [Candidatus Brocadiae bacterium]|nr:trypsin-like peptidase domain-containing protein [Candidatus Brocadiia bacterium]